jgi:hypothetical protein
MSRYKPKKDVVAWDLATATKGPTETQRGVWRLFAFILAEEMFPERFAELKRRVLPIYERHLASPTRPDQEVHIRYSHAHFACPAFVELEQRIARWARKLGIVSYFDANPSPPECDLWLRDLALRRVQSWHAGEEKMAVPAIGGIPALIIPGLLSHESAAQFQGRVRKSTVEYLQKEALPWRATRRWRHHFVWFLRYRIEKITLAELAAEHAREQCTACTAPTVLGGIRSVAALLGVTL